MKSLNFGRSDYNAELNVFPPTENDEPAFLIRASDMIGLDVLSAYIAFYAPFIKRDSDNDAAVLASLQEHKERFFRYRAANPEDIKFATLPQETTP